MMYKKMQLQLVICTLFMSCAVSEVIQHVPCRDVVNHCDIHEVRINPCPQATQDSTNPCHIKRGRSATIDFDYTTHFNATTGKGEIFWISPEGDLPFIGMDQNACSYTQCPIVSNEKRNYSQRFDTMRKYPAKIFDLRWKLSNQENDTEFCCFVIKIKLTK